MPRFPPGRFSSFRDHRFIYVRDRRDSSPGPTVGPACLLPPRPLVPHSEGEPSPPPVAVGSLVPRTDAPRRGERRGTESLVPRASPATLSSLFRLLRVVVDDGG